MLARRQGRVCPRFGLEPGQLHRLIGGLLVVLLISVTHRPGEPPPVSAAQRASAFLDYFAYKRRNGDAVDPRLWQVEKVGTPPYISQRNGRIKLATGVATHNLIAIRGLRALDPLRHEKLRFETRFKISAGSGDFDWSVGLEFGPLAPRGPVDGTILIRKAPDPHKVRFISYQGVDIDIVDNINVAPTADHTYIIEVDKTGRSLARLYVDGVWKGTLTTFVPSNSLAAYMQVRTNTTQDRWLDVDYVVFIGK